MEDGTTSGDLFRICGVAAIGIGIAWALQVLGFAGDGSALGQGLWMTAGGAISGAGVGLLITAGRFFEAAPVRIER